MVVSMCMYIVYVCMYIFDTLTNYLLTYFVGIFLRLEKVLSDHLVRTKKDIFFSVFFHRGEVISKGEKAPHPLPPQERHLLQMLHRTNDSFYTYDGEASKMAIMYNSPVFFTMDTNPTKKSVEQTLFFFFLEETKTFVKKIVLVLTYYT